MRMTRIPAGAELVLTGFDRMRLIQRIADRLPSPAPLLELDVQNEEHLSTLAARVAHDGCRVVGKHTGHWRQVADRAVDHPEQSDDRRLIRGD